jgi:hypothetical protein
MIEHFDKDIPDPTEHVGMIQPATLPSERREIPDLRICEPLRAIPYLHRYPERVKLVPPPDHGAAWVSPRLVRCARGTKMIVLLFRSRQTLL